MSGRVIPTYNSEAHTDGYLLIVKGQRARWISVEDFSNLPVLDVQAAKKK